MKFLIPSEIKPYFDQYLKLYIDKYSDINQCLQMYINSITNNQLPLLDPLLIDCIGTYIPVDFKIAFLSKNYTTLNNNMYNELLNKYTHNIERSYGTFYFIDDTYQFSEVYNNEGEELMEN